MKKRNKAGSNTITDGVLKQAEQIANTTHAQALVDDSVVSGKKRSTFEDLPEFQEIEKMKHVSETLNLANPFFRIHGERAGATTRIDGKTVINFSSYDYLGLNFDGRVAQAAIAAIEQYGTSASASRLVAGERPIHQELEDSLAGLHGVDKALCFVSGHATNVAAISTLVDGSDLIVFDAFSHNSITAGATLSGAKKLAFPHNDLNALETMLRMHRDNYRRTLVVVEGLYSMDGDTPDLKRLVEISQRHDAWLMVDEAHSIGTVGKNGKGICELQGVSPHDVDIWMGTLSKSFASTGGYIAGSAALIELLKSKAGGFVYSVGLSPPLAAAALTSVEILNAEPERVSRLQENARLFGKLAKQGELDIGLSEGHCVVPIHIGNSIKATKLSENLLKRGINALPIIFPAVSMNAARLRFFITSEHTSEQIEHSIAVLIDEISKLEDMSFGEDLLRNHGL